jgi:hypothetical protein
MSDRIDQIETAIHDIISTDLDADPTPLPRTGSDLTITVGEKSDSVGLTNRTKDEEGGITKSEDNSDQSLLLAEPPVGMMQGSPGSPWKMRDFWALGLRLR